MNMQVGAPVLSHVGRGVATVTLNRPQWANTIDENMREDLRSVFTTIRNDDDVRAVVLTGGNDNFSVGADMVSLEDITEEAAIEQLHDVRDTALAVAGCNKPVIAAVEGYFAGAGIGLALLCDRIVASRKVRISFSQGRIGLGPDWGLSATLQDRVGRPWARKLLWGASKVDPQTALEIGLVDELMLPGATMEAAWEQAVGFADKAPLAIQSTKSRIRFPLDDLGIALEEEARDQAACLMSEHFIEGLAAIRNRRRPDFSR